MAVLNFFPTIFPWYKFETKMAVPNFSNNFSYKDWYKLGTAKIGCSQFFPTIFPKKTAINLEWPKMAVPNFFQQFFPNRLV